MGKENRKKYLFFSIFGEKHLHISVNKRLKRRKKLAENPCLLLAGAGKTQGGGFSFIIFYFLFSIWNAETAEGGNINRFDAG
jgi:hypothetical protein